MTRKHLILVALCLTVACLVVTALLIAAQTAAPPRPTGQENMKERVDALDSRIKTVEEKSDRAAIEKDYVERIQKQYEAYYEKAFNSQMWTLGIMGLILTAVFGLTARFGFGIFDRSIQHALIEASAKLRTEFTQMLQTELQTLKDSNAAQIKHLEENLEQRIGGLEKDLQARSEFQFQFAQGLAASADERYGDGRSSFRRALTIYKREKLRQLFDKKSAITTLGNIFVTFMQEDEKKSVENAKKELADELYNGLEDELASIALKFEWLAPLVKERKQAPTSPQQS